VRGGIAAAIPATRWAIVAGLLCSTARGAAGSLEAAIQSPAASPSTAPTARPSTTAEPAPTTEPARSKLDPQLNDAFHAIKAAHFAEARQGAEAYLRLPAAAHPGQAYFIIGLSYHQQQLYETARAQFAHAIELEPDYATSYVYYGFALFNLGRLDDAKHAFDTNLARRPEEAEALFGWGLVALEQDRVSDAEQAFNRAIGSVESKLKTASSAASGGLRKDLARYEARLADVYLRRDDQQAARTALERSVELWPDYYEPWHKLARVLQRLGDAAGSERAEARSQVALKRRMEQGPPQP
jgi:tetratricopeptide (TPR) repeat protein